MNEITLDEFIKKYPNAFQWDTLNPPFVCIYNTTKRINRSTFMNKKWKWKSIFRLWKDSLIEMFLALIGIPKKRLYLCSFGCGEGWRSLVEPIVKRVNETEGVYIHQVKEKFGGLRIYLSTYTDGLSQMVDDAERASFKICEYCGTKEDVTSEGGWIKTLCKECRNANR